MKKKFLCFLMVLCMITSSIGFTAIANSTARINLSENSGNFSISLDGADTYGGELIVSFYNNQNKICQVKNYAAYDGVTYSADAPADAAKVKAVWVKSFENLKPLCKPAEANIIKENAIEIDASLIDLDNMDIEKKGYIEYYETATSTKATKAYVKVDDNDNVLLDVYVNGVAKASFDAALGLCVDQDAIVKLIENTNDKYYDVAEITLYEHYIVTEVDTAKEKITFDGAVQSTVSFADLLDDETMTIAFKDAEGADITVADFKEGDVVAVVAKSLGKVKPSVTNNVVTYYNLGDNSVVGTVTSLNFRDKVLYLDGIAYNVVDVTALDEGFELGTKATYHLTKTNKIFMYTKLHYDIAYVLDCEIKDNIFDTTLEFKLLTEDGKIIVTNAFKSFSYTMYDGTSYYINTENNGDIIEEIYSEYGRAESEDRLVKYSINSDNCLRSIRAFDASEITSFTTSKWYSDLSTIQGNELAQDAKIFVIDETNANNSYVTTISSLKDENEYSGFVTYFSDFWLTYSVAVLSAKDVGEIEREPEPEPEPDTNTTSAYSYAYILDCAEVCGFAETSIAFKILTPDLGVIVTQSKDKFAYKLADGTEARYSSLSEGAYEIEGIYSQYGTATMSDRLVTYTLNADGNITKIEAFKDAVNIVDGVFDKDNLTIDSNTVKEDTIIFAINESNINKSFITSQSVLRDTLSYNGIIAGYDDTSDSYAIAAFNENDIYQIDMAQSIAIVTKCASTTYEGDEALQVNVKVDNEDTETVLYFNDESTKVVGTNAYTALTAGSVLLYTADDDGYVSSYVVLATMSIKVITVDEIAVTDNDVTDGANGVTYSYVFGYVNTFKSGKVNLVDGGTYKAAGNMYTYEYRGRDYIITAGDYMAADTVGNLEIDDYGYKTANYVFMKLANNAVTDIYTIGNKTVLPYEYDDETIW